MSIARRLTRLIPNLTDTFVRFPVPVACSVGLAIVLNLDITGTLFLAGRLDERVIMAFSAAFLAAGAVNLVFEARAVSPPLSRHIIALCVAGGVGAVGFYDQASSMNPVFLFPGLVLAVMTAAYAGSGFRENAFWLFNARLALAVFLSGLVALVTCGGLSAIVASLDFLFDIKIPTAYEHIWVTGMSLIAPLYGLSLMPSAYDDELRLPDTDTPAGRGVQALINYVLYPLLAVYGVILYVYAAKIALQWELPRGQVGQSVLIFVLALTASALFARPWQPRLNRFSHWFNDWWFLFLPVPLTLLAIGIARRALDYGITPERYGLIVVGIWGLALVLYCTLRRTRYSSWHVVGGLSVLLLLGSFGPWGATGYSISDQLGRFTQLLAQNGVLANGKLAIDFDGTAEFDRDDAKNGASIVSFLNNNNAIDRLKPVFEDHKANPFADTAVKWKRASSINTLFGFDNARAPENVKVINFSPASKVASLSVDSALKLSGPYFVHISTKRPGDTGTFAAWLDGDYLVVGSAARTWRADLLTLLDRLDRADTDIGDNKVPLVYDVPGPDGVLRLVITQAGGRLKSGAIQHVSLNFWALAPAP